MKAWLFNHSQREGRECCFTSDFQQFYCVKACEINPSQSFCGPCEHLEKQAFTRKTYENQQKIRAVWRGECFFREIKYVYARKKGQIHAMGMVGDVARTSRRLVCSTRRVVFPNRRVVKPTPGLVTAIRRGNFCPFGHQFAKTVQLNDTLFAKNNLPL